MKRPSKKTNTNKQNGDLFDSLPFERCQHSDFNEGVFAFGSTFSRFDRLYVYQSVFVRPQTSLLLVKFDLYNNELDIQFKYGIHILWVKDFQRLLAHCYFNFDP